MRVRSAMFAAGVGTALGAAPSMTVPACLLIAADAVWRPTCFSRDRVMPAPAAAPGVAAALQGGLSA